MNEDIYLTIDDLRNYDEISRLDLETKLNECAFSSHQHKLCTDPEIRAMFGRGPDPYYVPYDPDSNNNGGGYVE